MTMAKNKEFWCQLVPYRHTISSHLFCSLLTLILVFVSPVKPGIIKGVIKAFYLRSVLRRLIIMMTMKMIATSATPPQMRNTTSWLVVLGLAGVDGMLEVDDWPDWLSICNVELYQVVYCYYTTGTPWM